jgi:ankyrin repeat protein
MKPSRPKVARELQKAVEQDDHRLVKRRLDERLLATSEVRVAAVPGAMTLLEYASVRDSPRVAAALIKAGAGVDAGRFRPLVLAAGAGHEKIVKLLLKNGADPNITVADAGERNLTPLMYAVDEKRKLGIVKLLLKHGADPHRLTSKHSSALDRAIEHGNQPAIQVLLRAGCRAHGPALLEAVNRGDLQLTRLLLAAGTDVNFVGGKEDALPNRTALEGAIEQRGFNLSCARILQEKKKLRPAEQARLKKYRSENNRYLALVKALIDAGANVHRPGVMETPLYQAARVGDVEVAELLLQKGADPRTAVSVMPLIKAYKETALHVAARKGFADAVKLLLDAGAEVNRLDYRGHTPADFAVAGGQRQIAALLKRSGGTEAKPVEKEPVEEDAAIS